MRKPGTRKPVAAVMIAALLLPGFASPLSAVAEGLRNLPRAVSFDLPEANTEAPEPAPPPEPETKGPQAYYAQEEGPEGRLVDLDEYSRTWKTGENTFTTELGGIRLAYRDGDGELKEVDNTLEPKAPLLAPDYYENAAGAIKAKFPEQIEPGKKGVSVEKDGHSLELIPTEGDFSRSSAEGNAILYSEALPGTDYQYTVIGDLVKEDIVLNRYVESPSFAFELAAPGLTPVPGDAGVGLLDADGNEIFSVAAPVMEDASGETSITIRTELEEKGGKQILTLVPDAEWLAGADRAYPVRIDPTIVTVALTKMSVLCVEQGSPNTNFNNNYPYAGYDDGIKSKNLELYQTKHMMTRTYIGLDYRFLKVPKEAKIESATFSIHHYTGYSNGGTNFGLYRVQNPWDPATITWAGQLGFDHEFIEAKYASQGAGYITWDVRETVNDWVQEIVPNYGLVIKAINELDQCEVFSKKDGDLPPKLEVAWSVPDPVDPDMDINSVTMDVRAMSEKNIAGKLTLDGVFADGLAKPGSAVDYRLLPDDAAGAATAAYEYGYPDTSAWEPAYPNGTKYRDKLSNWQTSLFSGLALDKAYRFGAKATYFDEDTDVTSTSAEETLSEKFLIYRIKQRDTFPYIANYYGVPLSVIMRDNRVQDALVIDGNTIFIRNPKAEAPYNPPPPSEDQMREIDRALIGRGLHCEYGFEPVNLNTGNFLMEQTDATIPEIEGGFEIARTYNSLGENYQSVFGRKWGFAYAESLSGLEDGRILYFAGDGKALYFKPDGAGGYTGPAGYFYDFKRIAYQENNETYYRYEIHEPSGEYRKFNAWGLLTDIVSPSGLTTKIVHDENFGIKSITSPTGKTYTVATDALGRIASVTRPDGGVMGYGYDTNGYLVSYTDADGGVVRYEYDANGRMTASYDQNDARIVKNTYDARGRVTRQDNADGTHAAFAYGTNTTTTTDANGNKTVYTYDGDMRTTKIEYADGETVTKSYGPNNTLISDGDMAYTYDGKGDRLTETRKDGKTKSFKYNAKSQPIEVTDYDGAVTTLEYSDASGDLTASVRPDGKREAYAYDAYHRLISYTDTAGAVSTFAYAGAVPVSETDPLGNTVSFGYDAMNRPVSVTDAEGGVSRITHNKKGDVTGTQSADGAATIHTLDKAGNPVAVTDPRGYKTSIELNAVRKIVKAADPKGGVLTYTYDKNGNRLTEKDADGAVTAYAYDARNRLTRRTNAAGGVTEYAYDKKGRLIREASPGGAVTETEYDESLDLPLKVTESPGGTTEYEYDPVGRLVRQTNPDGTFISCVYNTAGRPAQTADEQGLTVTYAYDAADRVVAVTENGAATYTFEYDALGNLIKSTDPLGGVSLCEYDGSGRAIRKTDAEGNETSYEYDAAGRLVKTTDPLGGVTAMAYDKAGNPTQITDALGNAATYTYDEIGNLIAYTDEEGGITAYAYDAAGNPTLVTDALGGVTAYTYGPLKLPTAMKDALGRAYAMEYDKAGNLLKITLPSGDTDETAYDAKGRPLNEKDPYGVVTEYGYDPMGRVTREETSTGDRLLYAYDAFGRVQAVTDELGRTEENTYDEFSRITEKKGTDGTRVRYAYDALGRPVKETYDNGAYTETAYDKVGNPVSERTASGGLYAYEFDGMGRILSVTDPLGNVTSHEYDALGNPVGGTDANGVKTSYLYDKLGRLLSETSGRGAATSYEYDALSRPVAVITPEGGRTEFRYDAAGNLEKLKDPSGGVTEYIYDDPDNLIEEISPKGAKRLYAHDKHGVLTKETDPKGNVTEYEVLPNGLTASVTLPDGGVYEYGYDKAERLTKIRSPLGLTRAFTYDERGDLTKETDSEGRTSEYEYDIMHNLTKATDPMGAETAFAYDKAGRLVSGTLANGAGTAYGYDPMDRLIRETDAEGGVSERAYDALGNLSRLTLPGDREADFEYDEDGNLVTVIDPMGFALSRTTDLEGRVTSETDAEGNTSHAEYDASGRIAALTDPLGYRQSFDYDPHGNLTKAVNRLGGEVRYGYDENDNLASVTDEAGRLTEYAYDRMGRLTGIVSAEGRATKYTYDLEGNVTSIANPEGEVRQFEYDIASRLKEARSPKGDVTKYDYDKLNALVSKEYEEGPDKDVLFAYDEMGRRVSMDDDTGGSTYEYDILGRVTAVTDGRGDTIAYAYNEAGLLSGITYAGGTAVSYEYDKNDRLTAVTAEAGETRYTYDNAGRVTATERPDGTDTFHTYDKNGNLTLIENIGPDGLISSFAYKYDGRGYIGKETATDGEGGKTVRRFAYGEAGELLSSAEKGPAGTFRYRYEYDDDGNRTKQTRTGKGKNEETTYAYDDADRLKEEESNLSGKKVYAYDEDGNLTAKTEDVRSTAIGLFKDDGTAEYTYEYTVENRLKAVREGGALLMAAAYDGDGNRVFQVHRTLVPFGISKADPSESPDAEEAQEMGGPEGTDAFFPEEEALQDDERTRRGYPESEDTEQAPGSGGVYTYYEKIYKDPADTVFWYGFGQGIVRLFHFLHPSLAASDGVKFGEMWEEYLNEYELELRSDLTDEFAEEDTETLATVGLSKKDIHDITNPISVPVGLTGVHEPTGKHEHTQNVLIPEANEKPGLSEANEQPQKPNDEDGPILIPAFPDEYTRIDYELTYYLNDVNREHTEVALEYGKAGEVKNVYAYGNERIAATRVDGTTDTFLYDGRGSVAQVYGGGEVTQSLTYDPYGNVASGANANDLIWGYNAEEYNPVTGMQYLRARYYTPATASFITEDTYQGDITKPITLHKYAYADNNPVNRIDPSGHFSLLNGLKAIANTVVTAAKTVYTKIVKPVVNWVAGKIPAPVKSTINKGVAYVYEKTVQGVKAMAQEGKAFINDPGGYLKTKAQQAEEKVKEVVCNVTERISTFVEEHATTLKIIAGVVIIAGLAVGSVLTGGALSPLLAAAATGAVTGGGFGAVIGGLTSAATGEDWKEGVADGFLWGAVGGALGGGVGGVAGAGGALAGSTSGLLAGIAGSTLGRGVVEGVADTLADTARSAANGENLSAGGIGAGLAINVGLEVVTGGGAPPGTGKAVKNAVEEAVDSGVPGAKAGVGKSLSNVNPNIRSAFGADAKITELAEDTTVYRYYGGSSQASSSWFTPNKVTNPKAELALPPGNTAEFVEAVVLPKGTTIIEGTVAPQLQWGQPGGGYQYYVLP